ncbi:helix-turn-helix domain containing protein [Desulfovibrio sp. OttesenSCG-928-O18]|nr:helix-turn-helix domain containing protein [Desulfovibrio sp. OttesenSCG-928-O18]
MSEYTPHIRSEDAKAQFARILAATGCRTQMELANLLGIRQSSVSEVVKRNKIPPGWLVKLQRLGVNIDWITAGKGPQYIPRAGHTPEAAETSNEPLPLRDADMSILHNILRCFPSQDLVAELKRRKIRFDKETTQ